MTPHGVVIFFDQITFLLSKLGKELGKDLGKELGKELDKEIDKELTHRTGTELKNGRKNCR